LILAIKTIENVWKPERAIFWRVLCKQRVRLISYYFH